MPGAGPLPEERDPPTEEPDGDRRRDRHGRHDPDATDQRPHDLDGDHLARDHERRVLTARGEQDDERE